MLQSGSMSHSRVESCRQRRAGYIVCSTNSSSQVWQKSQNLSSCYRVMATLKRTSVIAKSLSIAASKPPAKKQPVDMYCCLCKVPGVDCPVS